MNDAAKHFKQLRSVYRATFCGDGGGLSPAGKEVMANLRQMSKYGSSPFSSDPVLMAHVVGMQDVVRHITMMLNISDDEIYRLTNSQQPTQEGYFGYDD